MEKELCPHCNGNFVSVNPVDNSSDSILTYLCLRCGYHTNTNYKLGTDELNGFFIKNQNNLITKIYYIDENTGLYWFPMVLLHPLGSVFPEGSKDSWKWAYVPIIKIEENEKEKYGITNKSRFAIEKIKFFEQYNFLEACSQIGKVKI